MNKHNNSHHVIQQEHFHYVQPKSVSNFNLAVNATLHCLLGCFIGEVVGLIISIIIGLATLESTILAVILGFIFGLFLGVRPLLKRGYKFKEAIRIIFLGEGISIAIMEGFEVLFMVLVPGVMEAGILNILFWAGMIGGLAIGFVAALPINYTMIKKGMRHLH